MSLIPEFAFSPLHGLLVLGLLIAARYGPILAADRAGLRRADFFPPLEGREQQAMPVFMLSQLALLLYPFFLTLKFGTPWVWLGAPLMAAGWLLIGLAAAAFGRGAGQLASGVYRFSRNPMYVGYFLYFAGVGLATASWLYLLLALIEQIALAWIIRSEERWCLTQYGEPYRRYMQSVGRYLGGR